MQYLGADFIPLRLVLLPSLFDMQRLRLRVVRYEWQNGDLTLRPSDSRAEGVPVASFAY